MKRATITAALLALPFTGCVKKALVEPVEDHYVQTRVIAESCKADGYGNGKCTEDDLQAMVDQACLIDAILDGKGSDACGIEEEQADGE